MDELYRYFCNYHHAVWTTGERDALNAVMNVQKALFSLGHGITSTDNPGWAERANEERKTFWQQPLNAIDWLLSLDIDGSLRQRFVKDRVDELKMSMANRDARELLSKGF